VLSRVHTLSEPHMLHAVDHSGLCFQ